MKSTTKLIYTFWNQLPECNKSEVKEAVKTHLFECIAKTPKCHVRKIDNYRKQIIEVNKLIICKL